MVDRPFLSFPTPRVVARHKADGKKLPEIVFPEGGRQIFRLRPILARLSALFEKRKARIETDAAAADPHEVLVFETAGTVANFLAAVKKTEGLEWLGESTETFEADDDFYVEDDEEEAVFGTVYFVMPDQRGLKELLALWRTYKENPDRAVFERGKAPWRELFQHLRDIRQWGPEDRLELTGLAEDWAQRISEGKESVVIEIEYWFRSSEVERERAERHLRALVEENGGQVLASAAIPEVQYHASQVSIPIGLFEEICNVKTSKIVKSDEVMYISPGAQASIWKTNEAVTSEGARAITSPAPGVGAAPLVGVLDGFPVQNHPVLDGRLVVDDPDNFEVAYDVQSRFHGTSMVSLVAHGDLLDQGAVSLERSIYIRPVLVPDRRQPGNPKAEVFPVNRLMPELIFTAVKRMFEPNGKVPAAAPTVRVINISIGDINREYFRRVSPLARVIDYLSFRYGVLFVVSAGNCLADLRLDTPWSDLRRQGQKSSDLEKLVIGHILDSPARRKICSPAESINAITVGALYHDNSVIPPGSHFVAYVSNANPGPYSRHGGGFRRSIKPDILVPGGRCFYSKPPVEASGEQICKMMHHATAPGQLSAAPPVTGAAGAAHLYSRGTSNAASVLSHAAGKLCEIINDGLIDGQTIPTDMIPTVVKALIVHAADWREAGKNLSDMIDSNDELAKRRAIARILGYGAVNEALLRGCIPSRVTLIRCGRISIGTGHRYAFPMPNSLRGRREWRRLTLTTSWMTPVVSGKSKYRGVKLECALYGNQVYDSHRKKTLRRDNNVKEWLRVSRTQVDHQMASRGTTQHYVMEKTGEQMSFAENDEGHLQVNCAGDALDGTQRGLTVPYAVVASLDIAPALGIDIYQEIRQRLRVPIRAAP